MRMMNRLRKVCLLGVLLWRAQAQTSSQLGQSCETDQQCRKLYNSTISTCLLERGICSNPFREGCLRARLGESAMKRVCNSDDGSNQEHCSVPDFDTYPELRIHNSNGESSIFMAWIYQILLTELAQAPATIGLASKDTPMASFYSRDNIMVYSEELYPWDALARGQSTPDCSSTNLPCVHLLPEVWPSQISEYSRLVEKGIIETSTSTGLIGQSGLQIPSYTAQRYPNLAIWFGLQGEDKRELLAELFQHPTTWLDYCNVISVSNCKNPDETSTRPPETDEERQMYFVEELYMGHFRPNEQNNCTANPMSCTGAVFGPPCDWGTPLESQLHWNGVVGLKMDGPLAPNGGYTGKQLRQIWRAANATKADIIMHWFEPDPLPVEFFGSDFEFQLVAFPAPSNECLKYRPTEDDRCSVDREMRLGDPKGSCRNNIQSLRHLIVKSIGENTYEQPEADQSPAYELVKNVKVTNLDMTAILHSWKTGLDPRVALCDWVVEHLDVLQDFVPPGYPRIKESRSQYDVWFLYLLQALGGFVALVSIVAMLLCFKYRDTKTMVFAQPFFMMLILQGFCMISVGAILYAMEPTKATCTSSAWLLVTGYTIELVPVLVKTSAINGLIQSSKKMKRVNIDRNVMLIKVLGVVILIFGFLVGWTVVDPPTATETREVAQLGDTIVVEYDVKCASSRATWRMVSFGWQAMLLLLAAVLAYQSRDVMELLNESKSLAIMVYSHFLFVCLRGVCSFFYVYDTLPSSGTAALFSLNYSLDSLFAMCIYVWPKIWEAWNSPGDYKPGRFAADRGFSRRRSSGVEDALIGESYRIGDSSRHDNANDNNEEAEELNILVCSANLGNAAPTLDSLEAFIPPGGACDRMTSLDKKSLLEGNFDLIAIGMQEATWVDSKKVRMKSIAITVEEISEEDILNALEEKNTAQLREMVQATLGANYCQVADEQRGQMRLHLWARQGVVRNITDIRISGANTGIGNMLANKGGIIATLYYGNTRISFLSAHLAAHEGASYYKTRCENLRSILREAKTFERSKKFDDSMTAHHMFVLGDLNFRTRFGAENKHEDNVRRALDLIEREDYQTLYQFDELQEGLAEGDMLVEFETLPCHFPPTFKLERHPGFVYKEQRTPSYTDRILFKSAPGLNSNLKPLAYEPCADFITSDHKPIRGAFSLLPTEKMGFLKLEGELHIVFRKLKCSDLPVGDADGSSDPYLMFLWDSVDLHSDNASLMKNLRELWLGRSWPRTNYISKTLNPYWKGERMNLSTSNTSIGSDAMLFIAAIDYDSVGKDEFLGGITLNLRELITMDSGKKEKTISIDQPLMREGKYAGRIKCKVDIAINVDKRGSSRRLLRRRSN